MKEKRERPRLSKRKIGVQKKPPFIAIMNECGCVTIHPKRGGKRPGSGRPPRSIPRVALTVMMEQEVRDKLRDLCKVRNVSQAEWVTDKIKRARK